MAFAMKSASGLSLQRSSGVQTRRVQRSSVSRKMVTVRAAGTPFPADWIKKDPLVPVLGFLGWTIPANIPVSAFGGASLFGLFTQSIGEELAHFPVGPSLTDPFWLYLITYHVGLFLTIFLGQIGVTGRKQGYFN